MTILRSNQTNGTFVGLTKEQDTGDPDWLLILQVLKEPVKNTLLTVLVLAPN
jgi:hypothetical protein